jgi:hypothetical protein
MFRQCPRRCCATASAPRLSPNRCNGRSSRTDLYATLNRYLPLPPASVNSVPSVLKSPRCRATGRSLNRPINPEPSRVSHRLFDFSSFNFELSAFNSCPFPATLDAASSITPLFATLTKNTRGGGTPSRPKPPLSFSAVPTLNPFTVRTSKTQHLKSFRIRTYEKTRGEAPISAQEPPLPSEMAPLPCYFLTSSLVAWNKCPARTSSQLQR